MLKKYDEFPCLLELTGEKQREEGENHGKYLSRPMMAYVMANMTILQHGQPDIRSKTTQMIDFCLLPDSIVDSFVLRFKKVCT